MRLIIRVKGLSFTTETQLWDRWRRFIDDILPEAESAGVILAAHPDDPPVKYLRQQPRLGGIFRLMKVFWNIKNLNLINWNYV